MILNNLQTAVDVAVEHAKMYHVSMEIREVKGNRTYFICDITPAGKYVFQGKEKEYYYLPVDQYNQPSGYVNTWTMTKGEYLVRKACGCRIYDSYMAALARAMD